MARSIYICYFSVREPLVQTQVIPYLRELVKGGHQISLLTFEGKVAELRNYGVEKIGDELREQGIDWHWLRYHKRFSVLATAWDIFHGARFIRKFIAREKPEILHGRVHVPTLMGALARKFSRRKPKLLFDIRGFFPEEYTDAGVWPENGWLYRAAKRVEKWLLKEADGFVVLTKKARSILFPDSIDTGYDKMGRPVEVIPCCVDLSKFDVDRNGIRSQIRAKIGADSRTVIAYSGSFGGWYMTKEMIDFFSAARQLEPNAFVMILTQRNKENVVSLLEDAGFVAGDYYVDSVSPDEVPRYLSAADIAISFIKACYSKQSSSPTKIAEYLACGLPIIANEGVGDLDALILRNRVGVMVRDFSEESFNRAFRNVKSLGSVVSSCHEVATREFDLEKVGGEKYRKIYERLLRVADVNNEQF